MSSRAVARLAREAYRGRVQLCRLRAGIRTQVRLSEMTGIPRATINSLECGRSFLSAELALAIRDVLGCRLDDLFELRRGGSVTGDGERAEGGGNASAGA